jgi:hypothetical protein
MKKLIPLLLILLFLFPLVSFAQTINFTNPLNYNSVQDLLTAIWGYLQGIFVTLSIIFIVIGAVLYITSAGNDRRMETAKGAILAALIGLAIAIAAPTFLREISTILGWNNPPASMPTGTPLSQILLNALDFLLGIVGTVAIIMMVSGGMMYLLSAGDEDRMRTGKKIFLYSVIGIALALAALLLVKQVGKFFV